MRDPISYLLRDLQQQSIAYEISWRNLSLMDEIEPFNWNNLLRMPIIIAGGDSNTASRRDLRIFGLCSLIDKRNASRTQINVIGLSILCTIMASWGLKISLGISCILLAISIIFAVYALYMEKSNLRQIQRELLSLLRDTPSADIRDSLTTMWRICTKIEI